MKFPKITKFLGFVIKLSLLLFSLIFLYNQFFKKDKVAEILQFFQTSLVNKNFYFTLLLVCLLMLVNWTIEAFKWRLLIMKIEKLSLKKSLFAVFSGLAVGLVTPNKMGEFVGRMLAVENGSRVKSILVTFIGSISQLLITVLFGLIGASFFFFYIDTKHLLLSLDLKMIAVFFISILFIFGLFFFFNIEILHRFFGKIKIKKRNPWNNYFSVYQTYSKQELIKIFFLSFFRYIVFNVQLGILILYFKIPVPLFHLFNITFFWFFIITVVPSMALTEVGIRGAASVFLFKIYFEQVTTLGSIEGYDIKVITSTFILWFINIILPSLFGIFCFFRFNLFLKNKAND